MRKKRYIIDSAVAAAVLSLDVDLVMRSGDCSGGFSIRSIQLRAELVVTDARPRLCHVRQ